MTWADDEEVTPRIIDNKVATCHTHIQAFCVRDEGQHNLNALGVVEQHCSLEVPIDSVKILQLKGHLHLLEHPVECAH
jgi:hypothetical protein